MQKVKNVQIIKKTVIVFITILSSFHCLAQKKKIESKDDYSILNKAIEKYFIAKKKSDSLYGIDISAFLKDSAQAKIIRRHQKRRKKLDTLHINAIADKILYTQFLRENAHWKKNRYYKKFSTTLDSIFSTVEVANYCKQLKDNFYLWDTTNIKFKGRAFINNKVSLTREEIKKLPKEQQKTERKKIYALEKKLNLYTFSKPIYSRDRQHALIAYNSRGKNILHIFKKVNNYWQIEFTLQNNMIIDKIMP